MTADLRHALAHPGDTNPEARLAGLFCSIRGYEHAAAVIGDFERDLQRVLPQGNAGGIASGVALDVGQAFLNDAEEGSFDNLWQAWKGRLEIEGGLYGAAF